MYFIQHDWGLSTKIPIFLCTLIIVFYEKKSKKYASEIDSVFFYFTILNSSLVEEYLPRGLYICDLCFQWKFNYTLCVTYKVYICITQKLCIYIQNTKSIFMYI